MFGKFKLGWLWLCVGLTGGLAHAQSVQRLNIISIVTDDQASWSLGCYGNKESITPHMDRLAREGARFAQAFTVTPVCSPSRATFMTGRLGTQLNITDWIAPNEQEAGIGLPKDGWTWPKALQTGGYTTALVGKWHLGNKAHSHPQSQGFDHFYGFLGGGTSPMDPTFDFPEGPRKMQGYGADLLTDEALRWLAESKGKDKPFALCLHYREPHTPYGPVPDADRELFAKLDPTVPVTPGADIAQVKGWTRDYYAAIHSVDRNLGRIFAYLEKEGLWDKTIIQFTSDHGYNIGHHGIHTKGNGNWIAGGVGGPKRPNMWDTSLQIPWLIRWPGVVQPGTVIEQPVLNSDTFLSVLAMAGVSAPADWSTEGRDFTPLLRRQGIPWRTEVFGQYDLHNGGLAYMRMIRGDGWKLVRHYHANQLDELYNLKNDPEENSNRMGHGRKNPDSPAGKAYQELQAKLDTWMKTVRDPLLRERRLNGWFEEGELAE